jgi:hypothetical protein
MTRPFEPAGDCRFSSKAAVRDEGALESRVLGHADGGPSADADRRFPLQGGGGGAAFGDSGNCALSGAPLHTSEDRSAGVTSCAADVDGEPPGPAEPHRTDVDGDDLTPRGGAGEANQAPEASISGEESPFDSVPDSDGLSRIADPRSALAVDVDGGRLPHVDGDRASPLRTGAALRAAAIEAHGSPVNAARANVAPSAADLEATPRVRCAARMSVGVGDGEAGGGEAGDGAAPSHTGELYPTVVGTPDAGDRALQAPTSAPAPPADAACANVATDASDVAQRAATPGLDSPFSAEAPGVPTAASHGASFGYMDAPYETGSAKVELAETTSEINGRATRGAAVHPPDHGASAGQIANGEQDVLVAGDRVDLRGLDALVPGDALDEQDVALTPVDVGQRGVAERMEVEHVVDAGARLPALEQVAEGPGGDPPAPARDEERRADVEALAMVSLPAQELVELVPGAVGQEDVLRGGLGGRALEHAQGDAPAGPAIGVHDVAHVKRRDLVLAQRGAQRERKDDVITKTIPVLAGDLEHPGLLDGGERARRAGDGGDVRGHDGPPADTHAPVADESKAQGPLLVGKRDEQELLDWLGTELGFLTGLGHYNEEPLVFEPYQIAFLRSTRRYRWVEKSRQVGFSFLFACEAIARCHLREAHTAVMVSYNLEDAKEKVNYARQLAEELPLAYRKKLVTDSKTELGFLSNGVSKRVSRIISNPSKAPRGKKGDLYLDELAHYANDREVYKGSTALILRSRGQLTGCSSPLGRRGVFWEIAKEELRKYRAYWRQQVPWWLCRFFCTDVARAAAEAPLLATEDRVRAFGTKDIQDQFDSLALEDFQGEFELGYCDESYSFFPYELILPCTSDELVLADDFATFGGVNGRLTAGFDVGRKRDLSELSIFEDIEGKQVCRLLRSYDKVPFADQEADLRRMLAMLPIARLSIDQNGIGMHLAENLQRDFVQVVPETFSNQSKEIWANDFKILLQRKDIVLPKDRELVAQIHSVKRRLTPTGKPSFEVERDDVGRGHADKFWSVALACQKERGPLPGAVAEIHVRIIG